MLVPTSTNLSCAFALLESASATGRIARGMVGVRVWVAVRVKAQQYQSHLPFPAQVVVVDEQVDVPKSGVLALKTLTRDQGVYVPPEANAIDKRSQMLRRDIIIQNKNKEEYYIIRRPLNVQTKYAPHLVRSGKTDRAFGGNWEMGPRTERTLILDR